MLCVYHGTVSPAEDPHLASLSSPPGVLDFNENLQKEKVTGFHSDHTHVLLTLTHSLTHTHTHTHRYTHTDTGVYSSNIS